MLTPARRRARFAGRTLVAAALVAGCRAQPPSPQGDRGPPASTATRLVPESANLAGILSERGVDVFLVQGDTVVRLSVPCSPAAPPAGGATGGDLRVPGRGDAEAWLWVGPGARAQALPGGAVPPPDPAVRREAATAGAFRTAGPRTVAGAPGCENRGSLVLTVDSLIFPSGRFTVAGALTLGVFAPPP